MAVQGMGIRWTCPFCRHVNREFWIGAGPDVELIVSKCEKCGLKDRRGVEWRPDPSVPAPDDRTRVEWPCECGVRNLLLIEAGAPRPVPATCAACGKITDV